MGCWNETCMVSHLPICYGDRIVVLPIVENPKDNGGIYATGYWAPFLPFIRGEYDDYGSVENTNDPVFEQIAKTFLPKGEPLLEFTGDDFVNNLVSQVLRRECGFDSPQKVSFAFVHEAIFDEMIQKCSRAEECWLHVCDNTRPFTEKWRYAEGVYCCQHAYYPSSLNLISILMEMGEEKRIEEMTKFTFALDDLRMGYHPTIGSGSQDGVSKFMLDMHRKFVAMAREMRKHKD